MNTLLKKSGLIIISFLNRLIILPFWILGMNIKWVSMTYEYLVFFAIAILDYILLKNVFRSYSTIKKIIYLIGIIILNYIFNFVFAFLAPGDLGLEVVYDTSIISQALIVLIFIYLLSDIWTQIKNKYINS